MCCLQFYQTLPAEKVTDKFLWGRLEPLLGYLGDEQKKKVLEALHLAYDSHSGQVMVLLFDWFFMGIPMAHETLLYLLSAAEEKWRGVYNTSCGGNAYFGGAQDGS